MLAVDISVWDISLCVFLLFKAIWNIYDFYALKML